MKDLKADEVFVDKESMVEVERDETFLGKPKADFIKAIDRVNELEGETTLASKDTLKRSTCTTYTAEIYIAGDIPVAKQLLREYCLQWFCVSIEPVDYIYTMGEESGMVVRVINYPRFPRTPDEIKQKGTELGELLIKGLHAGSCSVVCKDETIFLSRRDKD